jgi:hypothetical protein
MPRLEIRKGEEVLAVAEKSEEISVESIEDFEIKTPQMEESIKMKGTTIVLKGKYSEIKLFPQDVEKIKELI